MLTAMFTLYVILNKQQTTPDTLKILGFASRIVNVWNSLPEIVISADTTDTFKRKLDKFWQHQDILGSG